MKPIQVGLLGIGTVGGGVFTVLDRNQEEITRRAGRGIQIRTVADLDTKRAEELVKGRAKVVNDAKLVVNDPEIDVVVELIGGYGIAKELVLAAINNGKHVVTANKALLAVHGNEIFAAAQAKGVTVNFEAAVAGGIPIIKALREGLTANRIEWIAGIINGTTNFILSEMRDKGLDFDVVLKEAQRLGYAEADPTFDIEGVDAAHKATIMSAIAFGIPMQFDKAHVEGITKLSAVDIKYAEQLGYRIKLLGITKKTKDGIELRVHPLVLELTGKKTPKDGLEGKFSVYHGCAVGLIFGQAGEGEYADDIVNRPDVVALRAKVNATTDTSISEASVDVKAFLKNGKEVHIFVKNAIGSLENPMSDANLEQKFTSLAEPVIGKEKTRQLISALWKLGQASDLKQIISLCTPE